jgi:protein required for attachment to host cells
MQTPEQRQQMRELQQQLREEQQRLRQALAESLDRAVADLQFRQQLIDNPLALFGTVQGNSQEGATAPVPQKVQQLRATLLRQVVDRAVNEQEFRQQLVKHPRQALWQYGYGQQIEQIHAEMPFDEVRGFGWTVWPSGYGGYSSIYLMTGTWA